MSSRNWLFRKSDEGEGAYIAYLVDIESNLLMKKQEIELSTYKFAENKKKDLKPIEDELKFIEVFDDTLFDGFENSDWRSFDQKLKPAIKNTPPMNESRLVVLEQALVEIEIKAKEKRHPFSRNDLPTNRKSMLCLLKSKDPTLFDMTQSSFDSTFWKYQAKKGRVECKLKKSAPARDILKLLNLI